MFPVFQKRRRSQKGKCARLVAECMTNFSLTSESVSKLSFNIPVDTFFEQPQNLVNGHIDTSPLGVSSVNAQAHCSPVNKSDGWPSDTPDDVIHQSVVSKSCQTLSELDALRTLRPVQPSDSGDNKSPAETVVDNNLNQSSDASTD